MQCEGRRYRAPQLRHWRRSFLAGRADVVTPSQRIGFQAHLAPPQKPALVTGPKACGGAIRVFPCIFLLTGVVGTWQKHAARPSALEVVRSCMHHRKPHGKHRASARHTHIIALLPVPKCGVKAAHTTGQQSSSTSTKTSAKAFVVFAGFMAQPTQSPWCICPEQKEYCG